MSAEGEDQTGGPPEGAEKPQPRRVPGAGLRRCPECLAAGEEVSFPTLGDLSKHRSVSHPKEFMEQVKRMQAASAAAHAKVREQKRQEEEERLAQEDPIQLIAMFGREGLNRLKRIRFKELLTDTYAQVIKEWQSKAALGKWDRNPAIRDQPQAFLWTLVNEARIAQDIATSIAQDVFALEVEFADALLKKGVQPVIFGGQQMMPGQQMPGQNPFIMGGQYPPQVDQWGRPIIIQSTGGPPGVYPQGYPYPFATREDVDRAVDRAVDRVQSAVPEKEGLVEIPMPAVGPDGEVLKDEDGKTLIFSMKVRESQAPMMMLMVRGQGKKVEPTRVEVPSEIKIALERMESTVSELKEKNEKLTESLADEREKRLTDKIDGLTRDVQEAKRAAEEAGRKLPPPTGSTPTDVIMRVADKGIDVVKEIAGGKPGERIIKIAVSAAEPIEKAPAEKLQTDRGEVDRVLQEVEKST